jgi:hypothetical protein
MDATYMGKNACCNHPGECQRSARKRDRANQQPGAHIHPCPVVGNIISGSILFQIEGQPVQTLKACS